MFSAGWIKLYRKLQDCWIWKEDEPFDKRSAWVDLLLTANHSDKKILFNGDFITVKKGQILTSVRKLAERWKWSTNRVYRFLKLLENDKMIIRKSDNDRTLLTIENYSVYQCSENTLGDTNGYTLGDSNGDTNGYSIETPTDTPSEYKQEYKEYKNDKNILTVSKDTVCQTESVRRVVDEWNTLEKFGIASVKKLKSNSTRYSMLVARIKEYGLDDVLKAIDNIRHSKFLQGKKPSNKRIWVITFDWFVRPNCFPKVLEGQYNDNDTSDSSQQPIINKQLQELSEKQEMDNNAEIIDEDEINRICEKKGW